MSQLSSRNAVLTRPALAYRVVVSCAIMAVLGGCAAGLPYRRPGSDITVRQTGERHFLRALLAPCDASADSVSVRARDIVGCGQAQPDTAILRDPQRSGPTQKTP